MSDSDDQLPQTESPFMIQRRPLWLTILCVLLWGYLTLLVTLTTCALTFKLLQLENAAPLLLVYGFPPLILVAASIGVWKMRRWGGVLFTIYFGLEVVRSVAGGSIPFVTLPIGFMLIDMNQGSALSDRYNEIYLLFVAIVAVGIWALWYRGRLR